MVSSGLRGYPFFSGNPKAPSFAERRTKFTTPRKPLEVRSSHLGMQLFLGHSLETVSKMVLVGRWRIYLVTFFQCIYRSYLLMCGLFGIMTQLGLVSSHRDHGTVVRYGGDYATSFLRESCIIVTEIKSLGENPC